MYTIGWMLWGIIVGVIRMWAIMTNFNEPECITGRVETVVEGRVIIIGEAVVCGEFHSNTYGPSVAAWDGEIKFYHNHEEE